MSDPKGRLEKEIDSIKNGIEYRRLTINGSNPKRLAVLEHKIADLEYKISTMQIPHLRESLMPSKPAPPPVVYTPLPAKSVKRKMPPKREVKKPSVQATSRKMPPKKTPEPMPTPAPVILPKQAPSPTIVSASQAAPKQSKQEQLAASAPIKNGTVPQAKQEHLTASVPIKNGKVTPKKTVTRTVARKAPKAAAKPSKPVPKIAPETEKQVLDSISGIDMNLPDDINVEDLDSIEGLRDGRLRDLDALEAELDDFDDELDRELW
jgi:hypothetical protein